MKILTFIAIVACIASTQPVFAQHGAGESGIRPIFTTPLTTIHTSNGR